MKKSKILKNQEPISKSIWRFKQSTDGDDCPNKVRWEDVTLGGLVARESASSLAKSSSRSSVLSDPLLLPRFLLTLSLSLLVSIGVSDKPGFFSWTQQATRLEREANEHRRYITRRPQIPSGPLNEPNHESSGTTTDLWPTTQIRWREREREREREKMTQWVLYSWYRLLNTQRDRGPLYQKDRENVTAGLTDIYESLLRDKLSCTIVDRVWPQIWLLRQFRCVGFRRIFDCLGVVMGVWNL